MDNNSYRVQLPCGLEATEQIFLNESDQMNFELSSEPRIDLDRCVDSDDEPLDPPSVFSKCCICKKKLRTRWFTDTCLHKFCFVCGYKWMNVRKMCPVCRKPNFSLTSWQVPSYRVFITGKIHEKFECYLEVVISFRKKIYAQNAWVEDLANVSECYKEFTPQLYSNHPSQIQRLAPWLKREVYSLMNYLGSDDNSDDIVKLILDMLPRHSIQSQEFASAIQPSFGAQTDHFVHEFHMFVCSFFDIHGFDDHAFYRVSSNNADEGQTCILNLYFDVQKRFNRDK